MKNQPLLYQNFKEPPIIFLRKENYGKGHVFLAKILRYRCAACHPLQFFTKNNLSIQKAQVGIFPCVH